MNHGNLTGYLQGADKAQSLSIGYSFDSRTVGENINAQIAKHQAEIDRLTKVRDQLKGGASLLEISIGDLRQAMNY